MRRPAVRLRFVLAGVIGLLALSARPTRGGPGEAGGDRLAYALTGARVLAAPGRVFDPGVVVVRGGVIEAVGPAAQVRIPADARVFDLAGRVVHAAYLDPYVTADRLAGKKPKGPQDDEEPAEPAASGRGSGGPPASNRAADRVVGSLPVKDRVAESYRRLGFAVVAVAPPSPGVLRGAGAILALGDGPVESRLLSSDFGQYVSLEPERLRDFSEFTRLSYPASKMGAVALVRQSFLDALWLRDAQAAYAKRPVGQARPKADAAAAALVPAAEGKQPVVFEAADVLALLRAGRIAREMKLRAEYVGAGDEYRFRAEVAAAKPDLILRVDFPRPYKYDTEEEWDAVPIETLRRIDRSPSNPKWLRDAGVSFSITTHGLDEPEDLPKRVREAMSRGLSSDDVLASLTTIPARQLGLSDRLGAIEAGKIANLAVETGEPFAESGRVEEIWIDGKRFELPEKSGADKARPTRARRRSRPRRPLPTRGRSPRARTGRSRSPPRSSCATRRSGRRGRPGSSRTPTSWSRAARSSPSGRGSPRPPGPS